MPTSVGKRREWLCSLKVPDLRSTKHDSRASMAWKRNPEGKRVGRINGKKGRRCVPTMWTDIWSVAHMVIKCLFDWSQLVSDSLWNVLDLLSEMRVFEVWLDSFDFSFESMFDVFRKRQVFGFQISSRSLRKNESKHPRIRASIDMFPHPYSDALMLLRDCETIIKKIAFLRGMDFWGQRRKSSKNVVYRGQRDDNQILKVQIWWSRNFVVIAQARSYNSLCLRQAACFFHDRFGKFVVFAKLQARVILKQCF